VGPREGGRGAEVCVPLGNGQSVFFGEPFKNVGSGVVEVVGVSGSGRDLAALTFTIDTYGPAHGEVIGGFSWPSTESDDSEAAVLARMVAPQGTQIQPGDTVTLLMQISPTPNARDAVLSETSVEYTVDGKVYQETSPVSYRLHVDAQC